MGAGSSSSTSGAHDIKVENRRAESPPIDSPAGGDEVNQSDDDGMVIQEEVDVEDVSSAATTQLDAPVESPMTKFLMDLSYSTPGTSQQTSFYRLLLFNINRNQMDR